MKILVAHGDRGSRNEHDFNWCEIGEVVGYHGMMCDGGCRCGCAQSFSGLATTKATTHAVVEDRSFEAFMAILNRGAIRYSVGWGGSEDVGLAFVEQFLELNRKLDEYPIGTILNVKKSKRRSPVLGIVG